MNLLPIFFLFSPFAKAVDGVPSLTMRYYHHPPFVQEVDGKVHGLSADIAIRALEESGVPYETVKTPIYRQMVLIYEGQGYDCSMGWFKTEERMKKAKFSDPISEDGAWVVVGHRGTFDPTVASVRDLLMNPKKRFLYLAKFSSGPEIDKLVQEFKPSTVVTEGEVGKLLPMLYSGRADYFFISELELKYLLTKSQYKREDFIVMKLPDLPENPKRHIMCSTKVPDFVLAKINKAIAKVRSRLQ